MAESKLTLVHDRALAMPRIKLYGVREKRNLSGDEVAAIIDRLDGWHHVAAYLLARTGARIGEVGNLRWQDVDLQGGEVLLQGKTGPRRVPIMPDVVSLLREWRIAHAGERVLGVTPKTCSVMLRLAIIEACADLEIAAVTPHAFRRFAVDALAASKVDIGTAASLLGHSPEVMLQYYRSPTDSDRRGAVGKIAHAIGGSRRSSGGTGR